MDKFVQFLSIKVDIMYDNFKLKLELNEVNWLRNEKSIKLD